MRELFDDTGSDAADDRSEVLVTHIPRNTECIQDQAFGRLTTSHAFLDRVDRSSRDASSVCELTLCPSKSLSGSANPVHGGL